MLISEINSFKFCQFPTYIHSNVLESYFDKRVKNSTVSYHRNRFESSRERMFSNVHDSTLVVLCICLWLFATFV